MRSRTPRHLRSSRTPDLPEAPPIRTRTTRGGARRRLLGAALAAAVCVPSALAVTASDASALPAPVSDPAALVDPLVGTANAGNTFPGAVAPFGMLSLSPQQSHYDGPTSGLNAGKGTIRYPSPSGYEYRADTISGFSLAHLSGAGCVGAGGDVPIMPVTRAVTTSPVTVDATDPYESGFTHGGEEAHPGSYRVHLDNGVDASMAASQRAGAFRFAFPTGSPASLLVRSSDGIAGSSDAATTIDAAARTVSGSVTSGNFCGPFTGDGILQRSYYTLHYTITFDQPFASVGTWSDGTLSPGATSARGGTGISGGLDGNSNPANGYAVAGQGSGGYLTFAPGSTVGARVAISYVSAAGASANLAAEAPSGATVDSVAAASRTAWNAELGRIAVGGGTRTEQSTFYTALYHALLHPNLVSDVGGLYTGMDGRAHLVRKGQRAQYGTFSGWDVYRSQVQLLTLLDPARGSDIATSLLNQANENGGVWDRWTHLSGGTHVMVGDPSAAALAGILSFGGTTFPVKEAFDSLARAARVPTQDDFSRAGWNVAVLGQRPSLDQFLRLGYYPDDCNAWGCPNETLEMGAADYGLATMARHLGDDASYREFVTRSQAWQNQFNPTATPEGGYIQSRLANGSWVDGFDPGSSYGFVEGTGAQYLWMVQHDPAGLIDALGGNATAVQRLDRFFKDDDGHFVLVGPWDGNTHANMDNEPSVGTAWLYNYAGAPWKTQETVRATIDQLWLKTADGVPGGPDGIPGNDDLGEMSSWLVFAAMGLYPENPSQAELTLAAPLFPSVTVHRASGQTLTIRAPKAADGAAYINGLSVDGRRTSANFLAASAISKDTTLDVAVSTTPNTTRGTRPADAPPSNRDGERPYTASTSSPTTTAVPGGLSRAVTLDVHRLTTAGPARVSWSVSAADGLVPVQKQGSVAVGSSGSVSVPITLRVPKNVPLGPHTVSVSYAAGGAPLGTLTFEVAVSEAASVSLASSFEPGEAQPPASERLDSEGFEEYCCGIGGTETKAQGGFGATGSWSTIYSGRAVAAGNHADNVLLDVNTPVSAGDVLSYAVQPQREGGPFADVVQDASAYVAVDLLFTDGTRLSDTGVVASDGAALDPVAQGAVVPSDTWTTVQAAIPEAANGKTVDKVLLAFGTSDAVVATPGESDGYLRGWVDDVRITHPLPPLAVTGVDAVAGQPGRPVAGRLATFTGGNGDAATDFAASISWGDGTTATSGTVTRAADGSFVVRGRHTYGAAGTYVATVTVIDADGVRASDRVRVKVAAPVRSSVG